MNVVVIMGAGASSDFGIPTLRGVFKETRARLYLKQDAVLRDELETIFWGPRGHTLETSEDSLTVEEMLTLLQDWAREESLDNRPKREQLEDFKKTVHSDPEGRI